MRRICFCRILVGVSGVSAAIPETNSRSSFRKTVFCVELRLSEETEKLVESSRFAEKFADFVSGYTNYKIALKRIVKPSDIDFDERVKELEEKRT